MRRMFSEKQLNEMIHHAILEFRDREYTIYAKTFQTSELDLDNHNNGDIIRLETPALSWIKVYGLAPLGPIVSNNPMILITHKFVQQPIGAVGLSVVSLEVRANAKVLLDVLVVDKQNAPTQFSVFIGIINTIIE